MFHCISLGLVFSKTQFEKCWSNPSHVWLPQSYLQRSDLMTSLSYQRKHNRQKQPERISHYFQAGPQGSPGCPVPHWSYTCSSPVQPSFPLSACVHAHTHWSGPGVFIPRFTMFSASVFLNSTDRIILVPWPLCSSSSPLLLLLSVEILAS